MIELLKEQIVVYGEATRAHRRTGLNIIGTIANDLAKPGKYSDFIFLEKFWHRTIDRAEIPITLLCPYDSMIPDLEGPLQQSHSSMTRIVRGSVEKVGRVIYEVIQSAHSDPIVSFIDTVQDAYGPSLALQFGTPAARARAKGRGCSKSAHHSDHRT